MVKITEVGKASRARRAGIEVGDSLISINGNEIADVLDYRFYLAEREIVIRLFSETRAEEYEVKIKKGEYDDIGLDFETPLMDKKQTCKNGCIFCFIDQNPEGMRESIYFKDDDSRLSFLHGNYITLTNMTDADIARIVKMRFSPINVSVHTTNPELRVKMMKNKRSGEVLKYLNDFKNAGLSICAQIVLCRGINDGEELMRSMRDLAALAPEMKSVAVVPAGLTKYRDKLYPLTDFSPEEAAEVLDMINSFGDELKEKLGTRLIYAADEFYLKAGREIPDAEYYEEYPQIENGVGMLRSFADEFGVGAGDVADLVSSLDSHRTVTVVTGVASYPLLSSLAHKLESLTDKLTVNVVEVKNHFFGESITVSGLLTGVDIIAALRDRELGDEVILPANCLRAGEDVFLCGTTLDQFRDALKTNVRVCENDGFGFIDAAFGI
jgi:putative radical SAM enzyme (TIGR03279 family)